MAIGAIVDIDPFSGGIGRGTVMPASVKRAWFTAVTAGGPAVLDAATITNVATQLNTTSLICTMPINSTLIAVRLGYDDGLTGITDPVIGLFGRYDATDVWMPLRNLANSESATLTTGAADIVDGTTLEVGSKKYTAVDNEAHIFDCKGCAQIALGIKTALAGTGIVNTSIVQIKAF